MNVPVTTRQMTPVETYTQQVIGDPRREADLWSALPQHIRPERFKRNLINALMQNPKLMNHDPRLTFREVSKAAALGLLLDPQLGEAYIIESWAAGGPQPQLRVGYRGVMKLARQSDEIANIYPGEVRELDHFLVEEGTEKRLEHRPDYTKPRGKPVCYYACVIYKDGTKDFEVMDMESIYAIRDRSDAWKAFKAGKIKSTPWATDEGEMCKKTPLRRLMKRVPQSPELAEAMAMENAADFAPATPRAPIRHLRPVEAAPTINARLADFAAEQPEPDIEESAAGNPSPAAEPQGSPALDGTLAPPLSSPGESGAGTPDPIAEAQQAGRDACDAGVDFNEVPQKYKRYKNHEKAWREGYEQRAHQFETEMNA